MKKYFVLIILFKCFIINAQTTENYLLGRIVNAENDQPVPFASISIINSRLGAVANNQGDFRIPGSFGSAEDTIVISCIGFERMCFPLYRLKDDVINIVKIPPIQYQIQEVTINSFKQSRFSKNIVEKAVRNLKNNISKDDSRYVSYFRTYQRKEEEYFNLNEALIYTLDHGIDANYSQNENYILDFRINENFPLMDIDPRYNEKKYIPDVTVRDFGGNELFLLQIVNAIANPKIKTVSYIERLSKDFIGNHDFGQESKLLFNNKELYHIPFRVSNNLQNEKIRIMGSIYIEPLAYRIFKLEYLVIYDFEDQRHDLYNVKIEYAVDKDDRYMKLKYISLNNYFITEDPYDDFIFKLIGYEINIEDNAVFAKFNNQLDINSKKYGFFIVYMGNRRLYYIDKEIRDSSVILKFDKNDMKYFTNVFSNDSSNVFRLEASLFHDIEGRGLDGKRNIELYQYREFFVIDNKPEVYDDLKCKLIYKPLEEHCINKTVDIGKYWMNSPINREELLRY